MTADPFSALLGPGRSGGRANQRDEYNPDGLAFDIIYEERESLYNADYFTPERAADESGYLLCEVTISDVWLRPAWLSPADRGSEQAMSDIDPDWEPGDPTPSHELVSCAPEHPGAIRFLRVTPPTR